ncbi:MAG: transposase [Sphingobium yanoikuyae]|nr:transposase [Sphingobium yanoikuyae]
MQGLPIRLGLTAEQANGGQVADDLLKRLGPHMIVLADRAYGADRIRALIERQGPTPDIQANSIESGSPASANDYTANAI